jgi:RNA polymerase sigma factor (sigma-70 family)
MPDDQSFDVAGRLDRVRRGDQVAARELVEFLHPVVIRIVRAHLPRRDSEEDLAQEVFLKMFSRLDQYQGSVPFPHWVSRIAVTTCIDRLRSQRRRPEFRRADLTEAESEAIDRVSADGAPAPNEAVAARELVDRLLGQLPAADRLVVRMLDLEGRSVAEVGAATGWNQALIKVRAFRARRKLQKYFEALEKEEKS